MRIYYKLQEKIDIRNLDVLEQPRGDMIEISSLISKRLYKITLNKNSVRGNHYHFNQIEEFYVNKDKVTFLLSFSDDVNVVEIIHCNKNQIITIKPEIIHTLTNDFLENIPEIIISSTQEYIKGEIPDTKYINII